MQLAPATPLVLALLSSGPAPSVTPESAATPPPAVRLSDATAASGLDFVHRAARTPAKYLPETMGAGVALLDHDGDGDLDIYLVQGGDASPADSPAGRGNELWRNESSPDVGLRFRRVEGDGGAGDEGLGMGACVGDIDGDGDPDLLVTNVGPDVLYLNEGGTFRKMGEAGGVVGEGFSSSCTFLDADLDGDLDLYVVGYVDFHPVSKHPFCGNTAKKVRAYCHPDAYQGLRDSFYLNDGKGRFRDATEEAGLGESRGKGLGVVAVDHDRDGDVDLFVANDSTPNFLWQNDGKGRFRDRAVLSGAGFDERGRALACMGIAVGDMTGDGRTDLFVTNLDLQPNTLYAAEGRGAFRDITAPAGLVAPDRGYVGFPTEAWDADLDGDLDLYVGNGHIIDNIAWFNSSMTHAQPDQLMLNDGRGRFAEGPEAGDIGKDPAVARGSAVGDLDGDGDLDLVVTNNGGAARLFRNDGAEARPHLVLELRATASHHEAIGARVEVLRAGTADAEGLVVARGVVLGGRSFLSDGTRRLHLACPTKGAAKVVVHWPGGAVETWEDLRPFGRHSLVEGEAPRSRPLSPGGALSSRRPFSSPRPPLESSPP